MDCKTDVKIDRKMDRWVRAIAGIIIILSLGLGYFMSPWWFLLTAYVGVMLTQSAFTNWCPMEDGLDKLGVARKNRKNPYFR